MDYEKYIKIPMVIVSDKNISNSAKILYGYVLLLSHLNGYCYATNRKLSKFLGTTSRTITKLIKELKDRDYIELKYINVSTRKIYINNNIKTSITVDNVF